jgi:hypothetical protein
MERSELQTAPPEHESRAHEKAVVAPEQVNDSSAALFDRFFGGASGESQNGRAARLLRSLSLSHSASGSVRTIAFKRAQQTHGNHFAQRVVRGIQHKPPTSRIVQRECACGGTCEKCRASASPSINAAGPVVALSSSRLIQAQRALSSARETTEPAPAGSLIPAESPGEPLDEQTRLFMESRFKRDLRDVRVHRDVQSAESANALDADAYTTGRDIYFAPGKYDPAMQEGRHLIAHEIAHTVQQGQGAASDTTAMASRGIVIGAADDPLEAEAERAADEVAGSGERGVPLSADAQRPIRRSWIGSAWEATGGRVVSYVGEKVEGAIEAVEDWVIEKIEEYAPGLLTLLRGGVVEYVKERITSALDGKFGEVTTRVQKDGFLGAAAGTFGELTTGLGKAASGLAASACESFAHVAEVVTNFAKSVAGPLFDGVKTVAGWVGRFFSFLWNDIVGPVWEGIKSIAGTVWKWIEDKAKWIWDKTAFIRQTIGRAWNWIKRQFGVAWESGTGVLDWLKEKAKAAWDWIYEFTKPIHGPLKIIGGVLLLLSPFGPIIAIWKGAPVLWDALTWLYSQWKKTDFIVVARKALTEHILPAVVSGTQAAAGFLETAANWIVEKVDSINAALDGLLDALGVTSLLALAKRAVQFVADAFRKFASWAKNDFVKTLHEVKAVLLKIWSFVKPVLAFLLKLVIVVANPLLLPIVITGYLWQALPDCFKPPIIDFILDLLIAVVRSLPTFKILGEAWPPAKAKILGALTELRNSGVDEKIAASNRVARIMSGEDLAWLGNLLSAMYQVPDHLEGQFEEELIGMNLTEPLPFERASAPESKDLLQQNVATGNIQAENAAVLSNAQLAEGQIGVAQVANLELEPELVEDLRNHGGESEFRGPEDPSRTIAAIQAEVSAGAPEATPATADTTRPPGPEAAFAPATAALSTDEQLETFMNQPAPDTCTQEKPKAEGGSSIPEELKIGPLTRGQRARYLLHQIGQGIKTWFKCNAYWLIPAIIGVVAVLIAVEILTGGAITAALPAVLDVITAIIIGVAAVRVAAYTAEYVAKAITGDVTGAAKSLARGLAIAAIELIFALLFNLDKVIKSLKQGLKATAEAAAKAVKTGIKTTIESVEQLGKIGIKGVKTAGRNIVGFGKAIVRNGKLLLEGVTEGVAKGIRKVKDLFERLWSKLRFKAFRIRLSGSWFKLEGEINPWVLIAEGNIKWLEQAQVIEGKTAKLGEKITGKTATGELIEGLFVGGVKEKPNYRKIADLFFEEELSQTNVIHHAIEQQVQKRFKGLFTLEKIHGAENLRAILKGTFNSEVHLSKIRILWNDFYEVIGAAGLTGDKTRLAFARFRDYVDDYIAAMTKFMSSNEAVIKAAAANDKEAVRALLQAESDKLLTGAKKAARDSVSFAAG